MISFRIAGFMAYVQGQRVEGFFDSEDDSIRGFYPGYIKEVYQKKGEAPSYLILYDDGD
jgi:hypothetical protein